MNFFAAAGPRLRNSLPVQLRNPDITYGLFRRQLNGHLFREAWTRRSVTSDMRRHRKHLLTYLLTYLPMGWVGLGLVGSGWIEIFQFLVGWVRSTTGKVLKF